MSSLRVSQHAASRAIGQAGPGSGDAGRPAASADGASFAGVLGLADGARQDAGDGSLGGTLGGSAGGTASPRRGDRAWAKDRDQSALAATLFAGVNVVPMPTAPSGAAPDVPAAAASLATDSAPAVLASAMTGLAPAAPFSTAAIATTGSGIKAPAGASIETGTARSDAAQPEIMRAPPLAADMPSDRAVPIRTGKARSDAAQPEIMRASPLAADMSSGRATPIRTAATPQTLDGSAQSALVPAASAAIDGSGPTSGAAASAANPSPSPHPAQAASAPPPVLPGSPTAIADFSGGSRDAGTAWDGESRSRDAQIVAVARRSEAEAAATLAAPNQAGASPDVQAPPSAPGSEAEAPPPPLSDQVAGALVRLVSSGSREMVVRLHPSQLGDLTVRVAVSGREVTAWFMSPQPQVQQAVGAAMAELQAGLGNAGYNLSGAWVGADTASARQHSADGMPPPAAVGRTAAAPVAASGGGARPQASGMSIYV